MKRQTLWKSILCAFLAITLTVNSVLAQVPTLPYSSVQVNVPCPMGIQVNSFTGNLYYSRTDLVIPGRGLPIVISMAYNSGQSNLDDGSGYGWKFSYDLYYEKDGDDVIIYRGDGRVDRYLWNGGAFVKPLGVRDTLEEYDADKYRLTSPQGIKTFFDNVTHRHVTSIQDPNGNTLTFTYSDSQLTTITDASGRQLNLTYSGGRLTTITDPNTTPNRTIQFQYDGSGNLTSITDLGGNTTTYGYLGHLLISMTDPRGEMATIAYANPSTISAVINVSTSIISKSFAYDTVTRTTTVTDVWTWGTQVTRYIYDVNGRISAIEDGLGHSVSMTWDNNPNLTSFTDENGHTTSYTYDANGNVLTVTDPLGHVTTYTYDATYNKVTSIQDANNHTTTYQYDANGNLTKTTDPLGNETTFAYDANGDLTSTTDANNHTTTNSYNSYGDLTSVEDPLHHTTSFTYDDIGNMLTTTDANSHTTIYVYDALNRLTSVTNALSQQTTFAYDANGNLTTITDAESNAIAYTYDALNRLTRVTDALSNQTNYTYDQMGSLKTIVDAEGHTTTFTYDAANRLTSEADPLGNTTSYSYDNAGNLTGRTDANGDTTTYTYDDANRLTAIDYPGSNDVTYTYDDVGNVTGMSNADVSVSYTCDAADRLTNVSVTAGALNKSVSYTYDNVGNRATMTDPDGGVTTYTYDDANRLISLVNPASQTTGYTYDDGNRLTRKDYHNGTYALYTYDDADRLLSVTNKNSSGTTLSSYTYQYDNVGNRTRMTEANGDQTDYTYDALYRLTGVQEQLRVDFNSDCVVNVSDIQQSASAWRTANPTFDLDESGLVRVDDIMGVAARWGETCQHAAYTYDAVGNRTQLVDSSGTTNHSYDNADRLLSAGTTTYGWDDNGNQTSKVEGGDTTTYAYDYENRLTGITFPDSSTNSFTYYPDGRRLSATDKAGTTYCFYDGFNVLAGTDSSGTTVARYTSGLGIDEWVSMDRGGSSYTYHHDGLGSVVGLTNASETTVATYQYNPFGIITNSTGSVVNPYRFTGREYDIESNLYFYRTRYYDAEIGRFTTKDRFPGSRESPISLNKYGYVNGNPINFVDPTGEWVGLVIAGLVIVAGLATAYYGAQQMMSAAESFNAYRERQFANPGGPESRTLGDPSSASQFLQGAQTVAGSVPGTSITGPPPTSTADAVIGTVLNKLNSNGSNININNGDGGGTGGNNGGDYGSGGGGEGPTPSPGGGGALFSVLSVPEGSTVGSVSSGDNIFQSTDGRIAIHFATDSVSAPTAVIYAPQATTSVPGFTPVYFFSLEAHREHDWQKVTGFNKPVTIQASYAATDVADLDESKLGLYYFDTTANQWVALSSTVDMENKTVTASSVNHFSLYGLMVPASPSPPSTRTFPVFLGVGLLVVIAGAGVGVRRWRRG